MRGSPLVQTFVLIIVLPILGYAGLNYLGAGTAAAVIKNRNNQPQQLDQSGDTIMAEVELIFSSSPSSYALSVAPHASETKVDVVFSKKTDIENPAYHDLTTIIGSEKSYWLDVRWDKVPEENARYFVLVKISPEFGETQEYTFTTSGKRVNGVIDFNAKGENAHE